MPKKPYSSLAHKWEFMRRFRRHGFGWRSQPAIQRVRQAVSEIKNVERTDPLLAAEGAVALIERLSPALEQVDSFSGAIGATVNSALVELCPVIASAPADAKTRDTWLERLWEAYEADAIPYVEQLGDLWGELCGSKELASRWADRLVERTRIALSPDSHLRGFSQSTSACLSAHFHAGRYSEIPDLVSAGRTIWPYKRWAVKALAAMGDQSGAIRYAEACRGQWAPDGEIDAFCAEILLSSGLVEEAYQRYGVRAHQGGTHLATFRTIAKRYPHKPHREILADLVRATPGDEGKWFAAAKEAGLYDDALELARRTPCDPKTLTRAARDLREQQPAFAAEAGFLALFWLAQDYGYEIAGIDVRAACDNALRAAERIGAAATLRQRILQLVAERPASFVARIPGRELTP